VLEAALDRRNEILEVVSSSADPEETEERIRDMLDVKIPGVSRAVLEMQVFRLTATERELGATGPAAGRRSALSCR
jgi:hypothetical protein